MNREETSYTACIYQDGILIDSIDLSQVTESHERTYETKAGGYNIITVKPGEIAVTKASCPDHICVKQGFIHSSMLPITCLPNRLVIQLKENNVLTPDAVTY